MDESISSQDFARFIEEMKKISGSMSKVASGINNNKQKNSNGDRDDRAKPRKAPKPDDGSLDREKKSFVDKARDFSNTLAYTGSKAHDWSHTMQRSTVGLAKSLTASGETMMSSVTGILRTGLVGALGGSFIAELVTSGHGLFKTYQQLSDIGQTFGGSMIEMGSQAALAGLPLSEFAAMLTRNSTVAAVLADSTTQTGKSLGSLQLSVRDNLKQNGFYAMSLDQISNLTGDYAETIRLSGSTQLRNKDAMSKGITQFAADISLFSTVTGKSREEIAKATNSALRDVTYATVSLTDSQRASIEKTTAFLAAMPGETGTMLSKMLTQTIGRGAAYLTDQGKEFASVGASSLNSIMQNLADKSKDGTVTDEDYATAKDQFDKYYEENKDTLARQATMGNQAAAHTLEYLQQMQGLDMARLKETQKQGELTKSFSMIHDTFARLGSRFQTGLLAALAPLEKSFGLFSGTGGAFEAVGASFEKIGGFLGTLITKVFTEATITSISNNIERLTKAFDGDTFNKVISGITSSLEGLGTAIKWVVGGLTKINESFGPVSTVVAAIAGLMVLKSIPAMIGGLIKGLFSGLFGLTKMVTRGLMVTAAKVVIGGAGATASALGLGNSRSGANPHGNMPHESPPHAAGSRLRRAGRGLGRFAGRAGGIMAGLFGLGGIGSSLMDMFHRPPAVEPATTPHGQEKVKPFEPPEKVNTAVEQHPNEPHTEAHPEGHPKEVKPVVEPDPAKPTKPPVVEPVAESAKVAASSERVGGELATDASKTSLWGKITSVFETSAKVGGKVLSDVEKLLPVAGAALVTAASSIETAIVKSEPTARPTTEFAPPVEPTPATAARPTTEVAPVEPAAESAKVAASSERVGGELATDASKTSLWGKVTSAFETSAKVGGKVLSGIGKVLPVAGAALATASSVERAQDGDIGGAAIDAVSAGLDVSGFGSAVSLALQTFMLGRDAAAAFGYKEVVDHITGLDKINNSDAAKGLTETINNIIPAIEERIRKGPTGTDMEGNPTWDDDTPATPTVTPTPAVPTIVPDDNPAQQLQDQQDRYRDLWPDMSLLPQVMSQNTINSGAQTDTMRDLLRTQVETRDALIQMLAMQSVSNRQQQDLQRRGVMAQEMTATAIT